MAEIERALFKRYSKVSWLGRLFLLAPVLFPLLLVGTTSITLAELDNIFFTLYHLVGSALCLIASWSVFRASSVMTQLSLTALIWLALETIGFLTTLAMGPWRFLTIFLSLILWTIAGIIIRRVTHFPYIAPRIAWWESDERYRFSVNCTLEHHDTHFKGKILDINWRGCFVKLFERFPIGESITVCFSLFNEDYQLKGDVLLQGELSVTHPRGLGIRFDINDPQTRDHLKKATSSLRKLNQVYGKISFQKRWEQFATKHQLPLEGPEEKESIPEKTNDS